MIPTRKHLEYTAGYLELNLPEEARAELTRIDPADQSQSSVLLAWIDLAMAEKAWLHVITLAPEVAHAHPGEERAWVAWAFALRELQRIDEARDVLLDGESALAKPSPVVDYNLACYFCLLGDHAEARRRLGRVVARNPSWAAEARTDPDLAALKNDSP